MVEICFRGSESNQVRKEAVLARMTDDRNNVSKTVELSQELYLMYKEGDIYHR